MQRAARAWRLPDPAPLGVASFTAAARLHKPAEFQAAFKQGKRLHLSLMTVVVATNQSPQPRLGLAVSRKVSPRAVCRNRIKRQIRESFRVHRHKLPALDLVVIAKAPAAKAGNPQLRAELTQLWQRIEQQWPAS